MTNEQLCIEIQAGHNVRENLAILFQQNRGLLFRISDRFLWAADREDLLQELFFALRKAAQAYRPEQGQFTTLFVKIAGQDLHRYCQLYGRQSFRPSPYVQGRVFQLRQFEAEYRRTHGEEPGDDETAKALEITERQLHDLRRWIRESRTVSLDDPIGDDGETMRLDLTPSGERLEDDVIDRTANEQAAQLVQTALDDLPETQQRMLRGVFFIGLPITEAGERLGMTAKESKKQYHNALRQLRTRNRWICAAAADALGLRAWGGIAV